MEENTKSEQFDRVFLFSCLGEAHANRGIKASDMHIAGSAFFRLPAETRCHEFGTG